MRLESKPILLTLLLLSLLSGQLYAEDNWWDKGLDLLKSVGGDSEVLEPGIEEIGEAFKQALSIGSEHVVEKLGAVDGFNADEVAHITLPEDLESVKKVLDKVGYGSVVDDLELKLNRAAESAAPEARQLFIQSISDMTFEDVQRIYEGPKDSATQYFKEKMSPTLTEAMQPIIETQLSEVGAVQAYDKIMGKYASVPFVPDIKADLVEHVNSKALDGIFHYIAIEEAAIREDPLKQSTALLKKVFGSQ